MTKMEMINRMIILKCIKEADRDHWMIKSKADVMRIYIRLVPRRLEQLERCKYGKEEEYKSWNNQWY